MSPLLRVLMLIDTVADADMLACELRHAGFELAVCHASTEATYLAELEAPLDLILADNALPAFDAMRALQILRTSERDIPLIVVTESDGEPAAIECVSLGATDFVFKHRPARLRSAVTRALDQRALRAYARAADAALRQSAAINQTVLDSLTAHIAVLNAEGVIIAVNQAWERFARANGDVDVTHTSVGTSYLEVCRPAVGPHSAEAQPVAQGITAVLARELDQYMIEYPCHSPTEERWFLMRVTPLAGEHAGAVVAHEDITARKRSEAALRESEARFRVLFEHSPDAIILIDPHDSGVLWPIVACNDLACRMNGYTRDELIGQSVDLLNGTVGGHAERTAYIERLRCEGTLHFEGLHRRKDGSFFPIEVVSSLIAVAGRELVLGIDRDISERKRAEDALRAAEAQYRTLVEQLPAIIYTAAINEYGTTQYVSPQIEAMLGFSPEEWLAHPDLWLERVHPDDRARLLETIGRVQASDVAIPTEYRSFTRDGRMVWLRDTERVVRDEAGRPLFMQGITVDITDRKLAEEALSRSERLYRTLASNFPNGAVVLFDHDLRFTIADGAGLADIGLTRERLEGHTFWEIYPPEARLVNEPIFRAALAGIPNVREITTGDVTLVIHTLPVRDERGEIIAGMLMSQDITERKRMEEALIDERALLARRVDERTADLSAANAELARAAILKDEFLASMSHELRTPLNAVLGLSEALQEEVYGPVNDHQRRSLNSIAESGRHLLDLINDILDLAKIGAGKLELDLEPTSIETICQASLRLIKQIAHKKQLSVDLTIDPAVTILHVDARRVKQILVNLLSNAVKFTPAGGAIGLEVLGDAARQAVDLTVWDTGIGIAHEHMGHLFQPFVQLDSRLARQYEGTGLGLALVYRMVELHGGSIAVTSEVGNGSRFTVALPWPTPNADAHIQAPSALNVVGLERTTIRHALIVEDSPTTAEQITRYLQELAITSATVRDGDGVVALAITEQPDLILLDLLLADSSGWDVLAQLKAEPRTRAIPVVIISVIDECARGLALGATDYLCKPVSLRGLAILIEHTLQPHSSQPRNHP